MQKTITKLLILTIAFTFVLSASYLFAAWTGPIEPPPGGNTPTPIHVGTTNQVKNGGLSLNALSVFGGGYFQGNVGVGVVTPTEVLDVGGNIKGVNIEAIKGIKIGNTSDTDAGTIRWTGTDFEGYNGTQWISLTTGGTAVSPGYTDCVNAGGNWVNSQGLCYIPGTSCPSGWTSKENYSSTRSESCGFDAGCWDSQLNVNYYISPCGTGQHIRQNKSIEECFFNGCSYLPYIDGSCFATQTEVGCIKIPSN